MFTISPTEIALYAGALLILFLTPGPVWIAVIARTLAGGPRSAVPLAFGVALGDVIWPLVAIFGVSAIVAVWADFLIVLRYAAALILIAMGIALIRHRDATLAEAKALTTPGAWAGFAAGFLAVTANPKASLFYMALLPTFFDFTRIGWPDIVAICLASLIVPLFGNLLLALFVGHMRRFVRSRTAMRRTNLGAGLALIGVGGAIAAS